MQLVSNSKLIKDKWYTVIATYDEATSLINLYINGILDSAKNVSGYKLVNNQHNLFYGSGQGDSDSCEYSLMYNELYSRALQSGEVEAKGSRRFYQVEGALGIRPSDIRIGC